MSEATKCNSLTCQLAGVHLPPCPVWKRSGSNGHPDAEFISVFKPDSIDRIVMELKERRDKQDAEHGGPEHDDTHTPGQWVSYIRQFAGRAEYQSQFPDDLSRDRYEDNLFDVAALAVAAIQSSRRKRNA